MEPLLALLIGICFGAIIGYGAGYVDRTDPIQRIRREQWRK